MDRLISLETDYHDIETDWPQGSFDEKQNYLRELSSLEAQAAPLSGTGATALVHDIRRSSTAHREEIIPAQQKRASDHWL